MENQDRLPLEAERRPIVSVRDGGVFANSRDVASFFDKEVKHVHEAIKNLIDKEPSLGLRNFRPNHINDLSGQSISHYDMDRDGFTLLAMGFTGSKALKWKLRYIEAFNAMEAELRSRPAVDPMQVLSDPAAMRGLLLTYTEKVLALESEKAALVPKAEALERIAESEGSWCITDAAKLLQIQPKTLFRWLRANGWTYRRLGMTGDVAYQSRLQAEYLIHKVDAYQRADGTEGTRTQVRVTPKGLTVLAKAFPGAARAA